MRIWVALTVVAAGSAIGFAQCHRIGEVNAEKPEGQLLQQIGQESDEAKKLALMEQFAGQFPQHEAAGWIYEQMQAAYIKAQNADKALEVSGKLIAIPPDCPEAAHQALKAAEMKKDPGLIKKWSEQTAQVAQKVATSPQPKEEDEVETWKRRVDYSKQVSKYAEYALYAGALQVTDPAQKIELFEALEQRHPQSEYLAQSTGPLFLAYRQTGKNDKAVALAEKTLATDQSNEDMLLVVADNYLQNKKDPEKVLAYSAKLVEVMKAKPKPEGVSDVDWQKRKNTITGLGYYISGKQYFTQNKFAPADTDLRQALPLVEDNPNLKAETLFLLGLANYKMERIQEAANFNKACAAIKSPYQAVAAKNLAAIRSQYRGVK